MHKLLTDFRRQEFEMIKKYFRPEMRILEIGGGTGYQASLIAKIGASVECIDVALPSNEQNYFPVKIYDGQTLPYEDCSFDIVFTSNVLEHISDLKMMLSEIRRVMKSDGLTIHILPTPAWRLWTSLTHYVFIVQLFYDIVSGRRKITVGGQTVHDKAISLVLLGVIKRTLAVGPHGEYPSAISELYYYSRRRWLKLFNTCGFDRVEDYPIGLFYTGYGIFPSISIHSRRVLSRLLGSATRVFVFKPS